MANFGVSEDVARRKLSKVIDGLAPAEPPVLPIDLLPAVKLATLTHDQVRVISGFGGFASYAFDQTAVQTVATWHQIEMTPRVASDLNILQEEGLRVMRNQQ